MNYMLLIYGSEDAWSEQERDDCIEKSLKICEELAREGKLISASPLQSVETALTVRVRNGKSQVTEGPYAETTEQLGGFYILSLTNLDEAIAIAASLPPAIRGTVEIRPVLPLEGLPERRSLPQPSHDDLRVPYMLLSYDDFDFWRAAGEEAMREAMEEAVELSRAIERSGQYIDVSPLRGPETATCVKVRDGKRIITDGPFTETREVLGGFYVVLARDSYDAARIAAAHPGARVGSVEVRPLERLTLEREQRRNVGPEARAWS